MTLFRASGLLIALAFSALLGWINYGALSEAYGSGPPYYGRTVNLDKWSDPLPGLLMLDVPALLMLAAATALFLRRQREREALEAVPPPPAPGDLDAPGNGDDGDDGDDEVGGGGRPR
ncbi:MAG: hypothetical protein U1A78_13950 [Polyangia bacterium]